MVILMDIIVLAPVVGFLLKVLFVDIIGQIIVAIPKSTPKGAGYGYYCPNTNVDLSNMHKLKKKKFQKTLRKFY